MKKYIVLAAAAMSLGLGSCSEDWISDVVPTDKIDSNDALNTLKDGRNAVNGVLSLMQDEDYYGASFIVYGDLKGPDVMSTATNKRNISMYRYTETTEASPSAMWSRPYKCLVSVNNALQNIDKIEVVSDEEKAQKAEIEANFIALRALIHFDLLKVHSRIPTAVAGDLKAELGVVLADRVITKDEQPERANLFDSYKFVMDDLKAAIKLMPASASTNGWFTQNAVKALYARVALYRGEYQTAYDLANEVIDSKAYSLIPSGDYVESWTNAYNNSEAILTLINTEEDNASREGIGYLWAETGYNTMNVAKSLIDVLKADASDERSAVVNDKKILLKYPDPNFNNILLIRLSEMYFIAAEAALELKKPNSEVAKYINAVLAKRTNEKTALADADVNIDRILLEKRKEFVGEGQTFFDLIRNKRDIVRVGDDHLGSAPTEIKYDAYNTILPIPRNELNSNKNIQQNPVYAK
ncbi:MAG: RagB/SusD family nutrient uptake outer membrane protein [Marinifilaceae bacterium]